MWRIHLIGTPLFALLCYESVMTLFDFGLNPAFVAFGSVLGSAVVAFTTARLVALWLWPDLLRQADMNAARRDRERMLQGL